MFDPKSQTVIKSEKYDESSSAPTVENNASSEDNKENLIGTSKERKIVTAASSSAQRRNYNELEEVDVKLHADPTYCNFCTLKLNAFEGIFLQTCLHVFCKHCLLYQIESSDGKKVACLFASQCNGFLLNKEIKAVATAEMYTNYMDKCSKLALQGLTDVYACNQEGCPAKYSLDTGTSRKAILCSICNSVNCIKCKAIHDGLECERYQELVDEAAKSRININGVTFKKMVNKERNEGFHHLTDKIAEFMSPNGQVSNSNMRYEDTVKIMEHMDVIPTTKEFECIICRNEDIKQGIVLQDCLHKFCIECLQRIIENAEEPEIRCPLETCRSFLSPREIRAIVSPDLHETFLNRSLRLAESRMENTFHCMTVNCAGWCIIEETANIFWCPICQNINCLRCKVIHEGSCQEYKQLLADDKNRQKQLENERLGERQVQNLVADRTFMRCPHCKMICQKISGCNHVVCGSCKRRFNWKGK